MCIATPGGHRLARHATSMQEPTHGEVIRALHEVGYGGAIDYDHIMKLTTDTSVGREYIAFCVGHSRGMMQALANL